MSSIASVSEAEILEDLIDPRAGNWSAEAANAIGNLEFSEKTKETIRTLLNKNSSDSLSEDEKGALDNYLRVGRTIDLLQAKAKFSLQQTHS